MKTLIQGFETTINRIHIAKQAYNRRVQLLAVSKTRPATMMRTIATLGQRDFGENYVQEALEKMSQLKDLPLVWHYIGHIQANKCRDISQHFSWVHTVASTKIAERLSRLRPDNLPPLNICIQVNISQEPQKSGCMPDEALILAQHLATLPRLRLRGLMAIPAPEQDFEKQRHSFAEVFSLSQTIQSQGINMDTLSMGMSNDLEAAIAEGATMVRIGTDIFGAREQR
jgi:PLP dependent protein